MSAWFWEWLFWTSLFLLITAVIAEIAWILVHHV
jgi:hypothetical protein